MTAGGHIFISYRRAEPDMSFAYRLAESLKEAGHSVWIDVEGLAPANRWHREIQRGIDESYAYVIVISPDSLESEWVQNELIYTLKNKPGQIYPVLFRDARLPPELITIQYVDFRDDYDSALWQLLANLPRDPDPAAPGVIVSGGEKSQPRRGANRLLWIGGAALALVALIGLAIILRPQDTPAVTPPPTAEIAPTDGFPTATTSGLDIASGGGDSISEAVTDLPILPTQAPSPTPLGGSGWLTFLSNRDADPLIYSEIYRVAVDGSELTPIISSAYSGLSYSPDGSQVVFVSWRDAVQDLYIANADGTNIVRLTDTPTIAEEDPVWSPDGMRIAFTSNREGNLDVFVMSVDGSGLMALTNVPEDDFEPSWSPDSIQVVFVSARQGENLYAVDATGGEVRRVSFTIANPRRPVFSPDGGLIACIGSQDGNAEVYTIHPEGSGLTRLTETPQDEASPSWSPDGRMLAFVSRRDGNAEIYVMYADGSNQTRVTDSPQDDLVPRWVP
jgi:TolB protein